MTFEQAQHFLLSLNNIPRKEYTNNKKRESELLKRIQFFLDLIGNPEKKIPHYIHVTGTSGKGSLCTYLHSILMADGKKVGLLTSPHVKSILERWTINNKLMTEKEFVQIITELKPALDKYIRTSPYGMLTHFDMLTIIGFVFFAKKKVEWAVIEVGLGGRLDSTNVLPHKDVAVITKIGLDHTEVLGDTKEKIAVEKAGIILPHTPVFTMETDTKILNIIQQEVKKRKAKLFLSSLPEHIIHHSDLSGSTFEIEGKKIQISAPGHHQISNALLSRDIARFLGIKDSAIIQGLKKAKQILRLEIISKQPLLVLDGAHNEDKMRSTVEALQNNKFLSYKKVHLVVGFSGDKDIRKMVELLSRLRPTAIACTRQTQHLFRKVAHPQALEQLFQKYSPHSRKEVFLDPENALKWAQKQQKPGDLVLVTGSIFLSGELR